MNTTPEPDNKNQTAPAPQALKTTHKKKWWRWLIFLFVITLSFAILLFERQKAPKLKTAMPSSTSANISAPSLSAPLSVNPVQNNKITKTTDSHKSASINEANHLASLEQKIDRLLAEKDLTQNTTLPNAVMTAKPENSSNKSLHDFFLLEEIELLLMNANLQLQMSRQITPVIDTLQQLHSNLNNYPDSASMLELTKALEEDIMQLKLSSSQNLNALVLKTDQTISAIEHLIPLKNIPTPTAVVNDRKTQNNEAIPSSSSFWVWTKNIFITAADTLATTLKRLIQIHDTNTAIPLNAEQNASLKIYLKTRLMSVHFALLNHNPTLLNADIEAIRTESKRYFDQNSDAAQQLQHLMQQLEQATQTLMPLQLNQSLENVRAQKNRLRQSLSL